MRTFCLVIIGMILVVSNFASAETSTGVNNAHIASVHYYRYKTGKIYDLWKYKHLMTAEGSCRKGATSLFKYVGRSDDLVGIQQETDNCLMEIGYERVVDVPESISTPTPPSNSSSAETR